MENIKWLFFDLGSTLVDESNCIKWRCETIVENNNINKQVFLDKVIELAKTNSFPVKAAATYYGVELPRWPKELEKLYPNVDKVLEKLAEKYKLGIIANQSAGTQKRIDNWGIGKYFDVVIASTEAGCAKPDIKIFNMALDQAKCEPNEAVMIGDRIDNDISPAKHIGMKTIWVRQGFAQYQSVKNESEQPNYKIDSVSEIINIL